MLYFKFETADSKPRKKFSPPRPLGHFTVELAVEIVIRRTLRSWAAGMISVVSEELNCSTSGELPRCMVDSQGFFRESYLYMATFSERLGRKVVRLKVWGSSDVF